jgi:hypothetical protein
MSVVSRHPLISFFVLTFALSWWNWPHYAVGLSLSPVFAGLLIAALIVIPISQGWAGLRELGSRMIRWRVGWRWYAVALGIPLAVAVAGVALSVALGASSWSLAKLPALSTLVMVFATRLIDPLGAPIDEEPGFRGFALTSLQAGRSPLLATAILVGYRYEITLWDWRKLTAIVAALSAGVAAGVCKVGGAIEPTGHLLVKQSMRLGGLWQVTGSSGRHPGLEDRSTQQRWPFGHRKRGHRVRDPYSTGRVPDLTAGMV